MGIGVEPNWMHMGRGWREGWFSARSLIEAPLSTRSPAPQVGETGEDFEFRGDMFISIRTLNRTGPKGGKISQEKVFGLSGRKVGQKSWKILRPTGEAGYIPRGLALEVETDLFLRSRVSHLWCTPPIAAAGTCCPKPQGWLIALLKEGVEVEEM